MSDRTKPSKPRCMPLSQWPPLDQAAWALAIRPGNLLDGCGPAADWKPKTRRTVISSYGRYLSFLDGHDRLDRSVGPDRRLTEPWLRAYLKELAETVAPATQYTRINCLARALAVMAPGFKAPYLQRVRRRLKARAHPTRNKGSRVVPVQDLLKLGASLVEEAETGTFRDEIRRSCTFRDGLCIMILACRPIRRSNLAGMRLDRHLKRVGDVYEMAFHGAETKNHRPYGTALDPALTPYIDRYLGHHRPLLLGSCEGDHVWISWRGTPMTGDMLYRMITNRTRTEFGWPISPHLFRDCAVTSLGEERPDLTWLSMSLLHHSDPRIAEQNYDHALGKQAVQLYQESLRSRRRELAKEFERF